MDFESGLDLRGQGLKRRVGELRKLPDPEPRGGSSGGGPTGTRIAGESPP